MENQRKEAFRLVGRSIYIEGASAHEPHYSKQKTAFYSKLFKEGLLKTLMPFSADKKAYACIVPKNSGILYYAGIISEEDMNGYEEILVPEQEYAVSYANGGKSRQLFDELEDTYFKDNALRNTSYNGGIILEVLLNGNPADAEVELWIPVK